MSDDQLTPPRVSDLVSADSLQPKPWWRSRTLIGVLVAAIASTAAVIAPQLEIDRAALAEHLAFAGQMIGLGLAWWGRLQADRPIRRRAARAPTAAPAGTRAAHQRYQPAARTDNGDPPSAGDEYWSSGRSWADFD